MVGGVLLAGGLMLNIVGIVLGSSRDLAVMGHALESRVRRYLAGVRRRIRSAWRRLLKHSAIESSVSALVSGSAGSASGASGFAYAWNAVPDDDIPTAIARLRERDETLREMLNHQSERLGERIAVLDGKQAAVSQSLADRLDSLNARIDDFDVKPAGQRALGAILVVCGTLLMALGGVLQQLA